MKTFLFRATIPQILRSVPVFVFAFAFPAATVARGFGNLPAVLLKRTIGGHAAWTKAAKQMWFFLAVISTQEVFHRAKQYATELLGEKEYTLEEVEQDVYRNRRVWRITVRFPKRRVSAPELIRSIGASLPLEYKSILVDI